MNFLYKLTLATLLDLGIVLGGFFIHWYFFTYDGVDHKIHQMYEKLLAQTGQVQDALPLYVVDENIDNAYNDGTKIVIYTGLINHAGSDDEIALVLGHEIAHGFLGHLNLDIRDLTANDIAVLEANADKMGAVYMMKAGYNICKGRELYKTWRLKNGNYLGQDHPDYSYRYDELNIGCE